MLPDLSILLYSEHLVKPATAKRQAKKGRSKDGFILTAKVQRVHGRLVKTV